MNDYSDNGINKVYSVRNHHLAPVNQNLDNSVSFKALSPAKLNFHSVEDQHLSMNRNNGSLKAAHQVNINLSPPLATPIIMPNLQEDSLKKQKVSNEGKKVMQNEPNNTKVENAPK